MPTKDELQGIGTDPPATWISGYPHNNGLVWIRPELPFVNVLPEEYWSSTEEEGIYYCIVKMVGGYTSRTTKFDSVSTIYVWPVRSDN